MLDVQSVGDFFIYLGAVSAALISIGVLLRFVVVRPLIRKLRAELSPVQSRTETIVNEVTPNGGGSMKDAVNRMESKLLVLEQTLSSHLDGHS